MGFFEMIKDITTKIISTMPLTEPYVGEVIKNSPLKVIIDNKITIDDNEIIRTTGYKGEIKEGTRLLFIRASGGQKFYLINTIYEPENA